MDYLNYHHLRYFWVVAKEGGLRKAAEKLRLSQPTISAQIAALEGAFGEPLFRRTGRNLVLTEAGHQILSYADEIFSIGQELVNTLKQRPTSRLLRVQIGITDSVPKMVAYQIIRPCFALDQPKHVLCREGKAGDLLLQLASYRLDIVLADEPAPSSLPLKVYNHLLGECGVAFCAAPKLASKLKRQFPASLNDAPALMPAATGTLRQSLEKWFFAANIRPRVIAEFDDTALMIEMAIDGLGFCVLPNFVAKDAIPRYGFRMIGATNECRQQFYAITAERKLTHPAVVAITSSSPNFTDRTEASTNEFRESSTRKRREAKSSDNALLPRFRESASKPIE